MVIIRNKGTKIINIGEVILMPDEEEKFDDKFAKEPIIEHFVKAGRLEIVKEKAEKKPEAPKEPKPEDKKPEDKKPEAPKTPKNEEK